MSDMKTRHQELHRALDELLACFIGTTQPRRLSEVPLLRLLTWSFTQTIDPDCERHAPTAAAFSGMAQEDPELFDWLATAAGQRQRPSAGGFVRTIAEAGLRADSDNYRLLRPALLALKAKYPEYANAETTE